ncbi:DUF421 domain-containing protein [Anaerobacillus alkalilacustris]|uniref:DUF421 domain-containing protein n=1 Tax=Anaerobacillus alkalilacustris TaxID=393763 RepID=A0A1S2LH41_9BACI|nr:DUF421 domain-containing protein [Anaerobacillus alkalilacustris]OIJ11838.1 DUF421 domain-containing protein [Anaerobacillus alkalilacustris]
MIEFVKDTFLVLGRIFTIIPLLLFITLFMGKRAIGELPIFDFLIIVILGAVVGADIADPDIKHFPTAIAIISIGIFQRIIANWKISNRKVGRLLTFEPTVVIQDGKFLNNNLKRIRYSIDNVLQMLREKNVFDISEVETAIIEPNGALSVLKKTQKHPVTLEDMNIIKTTSTISFPIIIEGTMYSSVLKDLNLDEAWLQQQLIHQGVSDIKKVFFASINRKNQLHISLKDENNITVPPIKH